MGFKINFTLEAGGSTRDPRGFAELAKTAWAARAENHIARVNTAAMRSVVDRYKTELRADIAAGGFRNAGRLSKTWRGVVYPSREASMDPAGVLSTKAATIVDAFTYGATIVAHNTTFLAIPTGPAKAIVRSLNAGIARGGDRGVGGRFAKQDSYVRRVAAALGFDKLAVHVDPATGRGVIVAPGARLKGRLFPGRNQSRSGDTVLFLLVRQATLKRRIRGRELLDDFARRFGADIEAAIAAESDRAGPA